MKKMYIVVLSTVTVICIVVGTVAHIGGWFSDFPFGKDSGSYREYEEEQPQFQSLKINADVMSVRIQKGDSYHISYKASERLEPKIKFEGDTLVVTQPARGFSFWGNKKCEMTVTVPEGVQLADTEFDLDVGNLVLSDLAVDHMKIVTDVGNVEMASCRGNRLEAESDVGNIDIRSSEFADTEIDTDVGNIYYSVEGEISQYNMTLATDIGKVTVDGNSYKKQFNQTASDASDRRRLKVETATGNIEVVRNQ